jgi:hypothetical protein
MSLLNAIDSVPPFLVGGTARSVDPVVVLAAGLALEAVPVDVPGLPDVVAGGDTLGFATGVQAAAIEATASNAAHRPRGFACDAIAISSAPSSRS